MRLVKHPGPVAEERLLLLPSRGRPLRLILKAGLDLDTAIAQATADAGVDSGWLEINDAPVGSLAYVIPDKAPNEKTVAWYSKTYRFDRAGQINHLGLVIGTHEGEMFLHGHGWWSETGGTQKMGHILPHETILTNDVEAYGFALEDARFDRLYDAETNFTLFQPVPKATIKDADFALLRVRPNEDFSTALDVACSRLGWQQASVYGLGSLVEAQFEDGTKLESFATELLILDADARADHAPRSGPKIAIVGESGSSGTQGRLIRNKNPILITAELFLKKIR